MPRINKNFIAPFLLLIAFIFIPFFVPRLMLVLSLIFIFLSSNKAFKREQVFGFLLLIWGLAFLCPAYWVLFKPPAIQPFIVLFLLTFGFTWAWLGSSKITGQAGLRDKPYLILLFLTLLGIHFNALKADIAWRGDEDFHIKSIMLLYESLGRIGRNITHFTITGKFLIPTLSVFLILGVIFFTLRRKLTLAQKTGFWVIYPISLLTTFICIANGSRLIRIPNTALRYPFFQRWLQLLFVTGSRYGDLLLYRAVPFLASVLLSWFLFYQFNKSIKNKILSAFAALAVMTIPILYYYSSILYLEMPAILLMTVCVFDISCLIRCPYHDLGKRISWYCLILLPFFKETAIIFLIVLFAARLIAQIRSGSFFKDRRGLILSELKVSLLLFGPLFLYITLRFLFTAWDSVHGGGIGEIPRLFDWHTYSAILRALFRQFALLLLLGAGGLILYFKKGGKLIFITLSSTVIFTILFFILSRSGEWLAYSRWNLHFLPVFIFGTYTALITVKGKILPILLIALFSFNLYMIPVNFDGAKKQNWEGTIGDNADYTYPYDKAIEYISKMDNARHVMVMGHYYIYGGLDYYVHKHFRDKTGPIPRFSLFPFGNTKFDKKKELITFGYFFTQYKKTSADPKFAFNSVDTIIYHSINNISLSPDIVYGGKFKVKTKITNSEHTLYILTR